MNKFKFNERRDIVNAVESNLMDFTDIRTVIWTIALYLMKVKNIDSKNVFGEIVKYTDEHCPGFLYENYVKDIDNIIRRVKKYELKNIDNIKITQSEMNVIKSFNDIKKEKIVFVIVAMAKYLNASSGADYDCIFAKTSEIFKYARVSIPASERDYYFHFAYECGVLSPNLSAGKNCLSVNIISHDEDDKAVLELNEYDYLELAYTYLNYKNGGYKRCARCGRWFKTSPTEPARLYCHIHQQKEEPEEYKKKICIDCGKEFYVPSKDNRSNRCESCYEIYRRKQKTETMRELRLKS